MGGGCEPSPTPYELGLERSPPTIDTGAIEGALSRLTLQETKEVGTVEVGVEGMSEEEEVWDGDTEKEIGERKQGVDAEFEEREESGHYGSQKKDNETREEGTNGDSENVENLECMVSSEKNGEEEEQEICADSEQEKGSSKQRICSGSENGEIEEKEEGADSCEEKKEVSEKAEDRDNYNEEVGKQKEEERDCNNENKGGEIVLKEQFKIQIPYPQRPYAQDCPSYLKTGYCSFGLVCRFNHPPSESCKVSANVDCKERGREGDWEKRERVERGNVNYAQPYPQREGKEDCAFYLKTGRCSYGANCRFNHPPGLFHHVCVPF